MATNTQLLLISTQQLPGVAFQYTQKRTDKRVHVSRHRQLAGLVTGLVLLLGTLMTGDADATLRAMKCDNGHSFRELPVVDGVIVSVHDGIATLNGQIRTPQERYSAYQAAVRTAGVTHVIDLTTVPNVELQ